MRGRFLFFMLVMFLIFPLAGSAEVEEAPYYQAIMKIMDPLVYSGIPVMIKPGVSLSIDFSKRQWILHHVHEYDPQGRIILEENRYGLCAELATFVYEKVKPLLEGRYELKFAMVAQAGFFSSNQSNHIVLLLADKKDQKIYLIDPSFHQYGLLKDMTEYKLIKIQDALSFVRDQSHDVSFSVDQGMPLYIKEGFLLSFSMTSVDGKFDPDNFMFVITATKQYKFAGRDILLVGRHNKEFVDVENKIIFDQLFSQAQTSDLFAKLKIWISQVHESASCPNCPGVSK